MTPAEVNRFNKLYQRHLRLLKLQGKSQKTIDAYSLAVRRVSEHFDCCPDQFICLIQKPWQKKKGITALKYLSRYLYQGVISEKNIVSNQKGQVTLQAQLILKVVTQQLEKRPRPAFKCPCG